MTAGPQGRSLLFLSCDLTGSTQFKQQSTQSAPWQKTFLQFYREFPQEVASAQVRTSSQDLVFKLWKAVGDELIFTCEVAHERDVYRAVRTWIDAMQGYQRDSLDDTSLGTKGGAFIATFPGPDSESSIPRDPTAETSGQDVVELNREALRTRDDVSEASADKYLFDYFGPSIDTGFRVLSKCSDRYFTLSVEVAFAMACISLTPNRDRGDFGLDDVDLLGGVELKGVWGGQSYPLFAIDLNHGSPITDAFKKFSIGGSTVQDINALCEACYGSEGWPFKLFLPNSANTHFTSEPVDPLATYIPSEPRQGSEEFADELGDDSLNESPPLG